MGGRRCGVGSLLGRVKEGRKGSNDLDTPIQALGYLLPYLPSDWRVWECAPGKGVLVEHLTKSGYTVVAPAKDMDFLKDPPLRRVEYDVILTNPPFRYKVGFIKRCWELGAPWALLLPVTTLGVAHTHPYMKGVQVLFLPHRIDFTGKKNPWFAVAWFTYGLSLPQQMNFSEK
jgi:hypothetical protein